MKTMALVVHEVTLALLKIFGKFRNIYNIELIVQFYIDLILIQFGFNNQLNIVSYVCIIYHHFVINWILEFKLCLFNYENL